MTPQSLELRSASPLQARERTTELRRGETQAASPGVTVKLASEIAVVTALACALVALPVHVWFAIAARRWLAFPFGGLPQRPAIAASVLAHNLRALAAVGGLLLIAQSGCWTRAGEEPGWAHGAIRRAGEVLLGAAVLANVIVVGASFGAYGVRMLRAVLPHGPVELAAYSLALSLYAQGRNRRLGARQALVVIALSVALLALAAVLETYVNL
jgi:hypothetical protein